MRKFVLFLLLAGCTSSTKATYEPEADREGIRGVVQARMKELRQCYYMILDANPAAEGKVVLAWDLGPDGKAVHTRMDSFKGRRGIENIAPCLIARVNSWQFPRPSSGEATSVSYPLYFSENGKTNFDDPTPETKPDLGEFETK